MIQSFLAYGNELILEMERTRNKMDEQIEELKREYFEDTPKLPRKLKKRRRKELNQEYSFLMSLKQFESNLFKFM
jgi:hypothetical protein